MRDGGTVIPQSSVPDTVTRRVNTTLRNAALHAYAFPRPHDEGWDPQLCHQCQWVRPAAGSTICATCAETPDA